MTKTTKSSGYRVRPWKPEDVPKVVECQRAAYPDDSESGRNDARVYVLQLHAIPEGQRATSTRPAPNAPSPS